MNSISPALVSAPTPPKSGRGIDQNSKLDGQSDAKFELPEKKSKGKSDDVANQNDQGDKSIAKDDPEIAKGKLAEDDKTVRSAETALLELINSYQPKNADKKDVAVDDEQLEKSEEIVAVDEDVADFDTNSVVGIAAVPARSNDDTKVKIKTVEPEQPQNSDKIKLDEKSMLAEKPELDKTTTKEPKTADDIVKASTLTNGVQEKDVNPRKEGQSNPVENVNSNKSSAVVNAEKAMSEGAKDQGSNQKDDRGAAANISLTDKSGTKMAGVEVLEAKTFIAPTNASTNANNISQAILKSPQISSAAAAQSSEPIYQTAQPKVLNTLKIQLNPAELGVVTATMKLNGDNLQVQLRVENVEAYRLLSEDSSSIVKALKGQGFGIDQINLTLATSDRGSNQQGNPQNSQSFQSHTEQEQMRNQDGNDRNSNSGNNNGTEGQVPVDELAQPETGQNATYTDGVYL